MSISRKSEISEIQNEITKLLDNLGRSDDFCLFQPNVYDEETLLECTRKRDELSSEWQAITQSLDDLLCDLEEEDDETECSITWMDDDRMEDGQYAQQKHKITVRDFFQWKGQNGQQFKLFSHQQMEENKNKFQQKYDQKSDAFRRFRHKKMRQLRKQKQFVSKEMKISMLSENEGGCSFILSC